jgi:hypothetical protein
MHIRPEQEEQVDDAAGGGEKLHAVVKRMSG